MVEVVEGVQAELPVRVGEGAGPGMKRARPQTLGPRLGVLVLLPGESFGAEQIRPAGRIVDVDEIAAQGPAGLVDAHLGGIDEDDLAGEPAFEIEGGDVEGRLIPRHIRVVPGEPCELRPIGGQGRSGDEVGAREDRDEGGIIAGRRAVEGDGDEGVDRLALGRVVLADRVDETADLIELEVAEAGLRQGRQRLRGALGVARVESVHPGVEAVGEDDEAVEHRVGAAAVLVDAGPHIGQAHPVDEGQDLTGLPGAVALEQGAAPVLLRMALDPVGVGAVDAHLRQRDAPRGEGFSGDGGCPFAIGRDGH